MVENIGSILGIIVAVISIWIFFAGLGKVQDSAISYGLENLQQNSQYERLKAFKVTFRWLVSLTLALVGYYSLIEIFRVIMKNDFDNLYVVYGVLNVRAANQYANNFIVDIKKFYIILFPIVIMLLLLVIIVWYSRKKPSLYIKYSKKLSLYMLISFYIVLIIDCFVLDSGKKLIIIGVIFLLFLIRAYFVSYNFYNKMANIAFLYYKQDSEKRYIYRKIGNQFLCGEKDYLQCDKKEFFTELEKVKKAIKRQRKKKNWTKENKGDLDNKIKKLARYSGYIRIDENTKYFEELKQYIDSDTATVVDIETKLIKMIGEFQEMTAVELVHEDKLKNFKIYPIIDEYHNGFFWKV